MKNWQVYTILAGLMAIAVGACFLMCSCAVKAGGLEVSVLSATMDVRKCYDEAGLLEVTVRQSISVPWDAKNRFSQYAEDRTSEGVIIDETTFNTDQQSGAASEAIAHDTTVGIVESLKAYLSRGSGAVGIGDGRQQAPEEPSEPERPERSEP